MQTHRQTQSKTARRGFTLIELLVVISIIATLMSLILPAIQNAREAGRRTQCLNNIRNVSTALLTYASANKSQLPALGYFPINPGSTGSFNGRSWVVELLPYLDQQGTYDRWNKGLAFNAGANAPLSRDLYMEVLACPNDESAFATAGGLSYVANSGYGDATVITNNGGVVQHHYLSEAFDWNGDSVVNAYPGTYDATDSEVTKSTGVFWPYFEADARTRNGSVRIGKIYDGSTNTIMLGENIQALGTSTWADPRTRAVGAVFPLIPASVDPGTMVNAAAAYDNSSYLAFPNESKAAVDGTAPSLNSNHPSIVIISLCDGSSRSISEDIDKSVYLQLVTPAATRIRSIPGYAPEKPVSGDSF